MDPIATLRSIDSAITQGDYSLAASLLSDYYHWRLKLKGFEPNTSSLSSCYPKGDRFARYLSARLCDRMDLSRITPHPELLALFALTQKQE